MSSRIKGKYGVDAPYIPAIFFIVTVLLLVYAATSTGSNRGWGVIFAVFFGAQCAIYLNATLRGKFVVWEQILEGLNVNPAPRVLDVGCGRGMVIIEALSAIPNSSAVGLDLWRSRDQSGNDPAALTANATLNDVNDRLEIVTEDMTDMSLPDDSFDLVVSNVAIQNIKNREARKKAIEQIYRVTKPGGEIRIVDIQYVRQYEADLEALGAKDVSVHSVGFNGWFGNPFYASKLVAATKPSVSDAGT